MEDKTDCNVGEPENSNMDDKTDCNVGEPENSDMDDKTDCNVGEPENSDADNDNLYGARSCDQNPKSPNLTVKTSTTETEDEDGYIPGPFTFRPECEMRPETSSWQDTFYKCGKNPGHIQFYTIPEFLKDTETIMNREVPEWKTGLISELTERKTELSREQTEWRTELSRKLTELKTDLSKLSERKTELSRELTEFNTEFSKLSERKTKLSRELTEFKTEFSKLSERKTKFSKLSERKTKFSKLSERKTELSREQTELKTELSKLSERKTELSRELTELKTELSREQNERKTELSREQNERKTELSREQNERKTGLGKELLGDTIDEYDQDKAVQTAKDFVLHISKLTTKVTSFVTSNKRPEYFPGTESKYPFYGETGLIRHATGSLASCLVPQKGECVCGKCSLSESKHQKYWLCLVQTATHGVCNAEEAVNSTFDFFDINKIMADQEEAVKNKIHDGDGNEVKDRKKVMEEWEGVLEGGKVTIYGTGITVRDFEKRHEDFINDLRGQSDDVRNKSVVDLEMESDEFLEYFISNLKKQSDFPFAGDMNVVVCVTHDEAIATRIGTAWTDWIRYLVENEYPFGKKSVLYFICPIVACPHGCPMMVSVGQYTMCKSVTVKELIESDSNNSYLSSHFKQYLSRYDYFVRSDTGNCLIPKGCFIYPSRGLCHTELVSGTDRVTLPARTKVETRRKGNVETEYSLRKTADIPTDCVRPFPGYKYFTYETPTCPGSSGALVGSLDRSGVWYVPLTHSGSLEKSANKSGLHVSWR